MANFTVSESPRAYLMRSACRVIPTDKDDFFDITLISIIWTKASALLSLINSM